MCALRAAGIIVWLLTGDKTETAINVAFSAKLFSANMELLKLSARSKEAAEATINFYLNEIEHAQSENRYGIYCQSCLIYIENEKGHATYLPIVYTNYVWNINKRGKIIRKEVCCM